MKSNRFSLHLIAWFTALCLLPVFANAAIHEVTVGDNFFSPSELTIAPGDTVRWVNAAGGNPHNVTSNDGAFTASTTASSFTFEVVFNNPGVFSYVCTIHPGSMTGSITVQGVASAELELQSINAADGPFSPGDMVSIDSVIKNNGDAASGGFTISYYASENSAITEGDQLLGTANVASIGAGATLNHQGMVSVPESITPGVYFIGAIIEFADATPGNNDLSDPATVTILGLFFINAGLNDAWVSDDAAFQGFFFTVFPDLSLFFLSWFTFDSVPPDGSVTAVFGAADQRWVTASGFFAGNSVTLNVELTSGGVFNGSDPLATQQPGYGTITIVFLDCKTAILTYDFPSLGLSGEITLHRVVEDNVPLCDMLNAELQSP